MTEQQGPGAPSGAEQFSSRESIETDKYDEAAGRRAKEIADQAREYNNEQPGRGSDALVAAYLEALEETYKTQPTEVFRSPDQRTEYDAESLVPSYMRESIAALKVGDRAAVDPEDTRMDRMELFHIACDDNLKQEYSRIELAKGADPTMLALSASPAIRVDVLSRSVEDMARSVGDQQVAGSPEE